MCALFRVTIGRVDEYFKRNEDPETNHCFIAPQGGQEIRSNAHAAKNITCTLPLVILLATIPFGPIPNDAKIYKWVDENETVHFSGSPRRGLQRFERYQIYATQKKGRMKRRLSASGSSRRCAQRRKVAAGGQHH
mgnify:CR=1 FL=1